MAITVDVSDVTAATKFLEAYLTDAVPDADFTPGSAVRDVCVTSIAHVFAYLRKEIADVKGRQTLADLAKLPAGTDVDEAVDALLSNFFISRKQGRESLVAANLYFSEQDDVLLPATTRFFKANGLVFLPAAGSDTTLLATNQLPVTNAAGSIEYTCSVLLRCTTPGSAGNIVPGNFALVDDFAGTFLRAETVMQGEGGSDPETTEQLLSRAPLALSSHTLVSSKSIKNRLLDTFSAVTAVEVVGTGEPEMQRDLVVAPQSLAKIHSGGMVDVYVTTARESVEKTNLVVGGLFARGGNAATILRDDARDFVALGVLPGDVLRVNSGFEVPGADVYEITAVSRNELAVSSRVPFPEFTDELSGRDKVVYDVGRYSPYKDKVEGGTGHTSRRTSIPKTVVLDPGPVYAIQSIRRATDGSVIAVRSNTVPPPEGTYAVSFSDTTLAQSSRGAAILQLPDSVVDGERIDVYYDSVTGLPTVQAFLSDPSERAVATDHLARAAHPVYVIVYATYDIKPTATDPGAVTLQNLIRNYIEAEFVGNLTTGGIVAYLARSVPELAYVSVQSIEYQLLGPDGQVYNFSTTNQVSLSLGRESGAQFTGAADLRTSDLTSKFLGCGYAWGPDESTDAEREAAELQLGKHLAGLGVSNRTTRHLANLTDMVVVLRGAPSYDVGL